MYIDRSKARTGQVCCLVIALVLWGLSRVFEADFLLFPAFVPMIGCAVFSWFNRCPCCGRWLGRHHLWIDYCPYCGGPL